MTWPAPAPAAADYTLPDLPCDYGALEPHISGQIMELHHSKHHQTSGNPQRSMVELLFGLCALSGVLLDQDAHAQGRPSDAVLQDIHRQYVAPMGG